MRTNASDNRESEAVVSHFYAMLSRMKYIDRWALMRNTRQENLSEHSFDVAVLSHALAVIGNRRFGGNADPGLCVLLALYHDAPEILTGDMPTPVKYHNPEFRDAYKRIERTAGARLAALLPKDLYCDYAELLTPDSGTEEYRIVKAADKLSALIKCVEEQGQGNHEFDSAFRSSIAAVRGLALPSAECFLDEFLPAYSLTLDELDG